MGKQTMGTPCHSYPHRTDNKMFRIMTPQTPIVRPALYNKYGMDNYPNGANAVVAVISYTGMPSWPSLLLFYIFYYYFKF
jgi:DNA-directed RNA polymerase I subunit RPA2